MCTLLSEKLLSKKIASALTRLEFWPNQLGDEIIINLERLKNKE